MRQTTTIAAAAGGSFALLAGAFLFQLAGYAPCTMCIWQRWPHAAAIVIGLIAYFIPSARVPMAILGGLAALTTAGIGGYHTGVERGWWEGPTSCTGGSGSLTGDLLSLEGPGIVMCDQVAWEFLTLSMASWNMLASLGLAAIWFLSLRRP